jgi:hypothetical protein
LIAVRRDGAVLQSDFDHTELGRDYYQGVALTTAPALTSTLKMSSTMGEYFFKKFYLYTRATDKTLKPTKYWSENLQILPEFSYCIVGN